MMFLMQKKNIRTKQKKKLETIDSILIYGCCVAEDEDGQFETRIPFLSLPPRIDKPKIDDGYGNIEKYPQLANKSKRNIKLIFNLLLMLKMAGG